ncbi:MAG: hypothetical protein R3E79_18300 [Caldilineaceae bacterium]
MRPPVWLLTIAPLTAFCLMLLTTTVVTAAQERTGVWVEVTTNRAAGKPAEEQHSDPDVLSVALQATVIATAQPTVTVTAQPLVLPRLTPTVTPTVVLVPDNSLADPISSTADLPGTGVITSSPSATVTIGVTPVEADTTASTGSEQVLDEEYAGPIEGTIIANRTEENVRFFVEGATYELAPLRSVGLTLPRVTAVLNLFNCDANLPETQAGCFWDPYLLDREGFYEIVTSSGTESTTGLTLQAAGTPPGNQIWIQNRTGQREQIFYAGETYDLPPSVVQEFTTESDTPVIFYLRSCVEATDRTVCEWAPQDADPGIYYVLVEETSTGAVPNSLVSTLELQPLFPESPAEEADTGLDVSDQVVCRLQVPVLNVRSGPGLQYQIISKVRNTDQESATVLVVGRDAEGQWLAVADDVAAGGWVTGGVGFISCEGNVTTLPVAEVTDGRLAPTPVPAQAEAPSENTTADVASDEQTAGETALAEESPTEAPTVPAAPSVADGQALIMIHNGFDQQIRFTLDQRYRVNIGPSEYDLQPGESINLLVYPGQIAFSASTPWRGLSGNDDFFLEEKQTRDLWITFIPDPDGSGRWLLQF